MFTHPLNTLQRLRSNLCSMQCAYTKLKILRSLAMMEQAYVRKTIEIRQSDVIGRYVAATKTLKPGELIISETPLMIGPPVLEFPVCLGCHVRVEFSRPQFRCPDCNWPLCSPTCKGIESNVGHSKQECQMLGGTQVATLIENCSGHKLKTIHEIIFLLRCLRLKYCDQDNWERLLTLESHNELRKDIPMHWLRNQFQIVNQIRETWNITEFSEEEIHTVCGILKVNCFGIGRRGLKGRALYPTTSMISHDCSPNARIIVYSNDFSIAVRSSREIKKGETITISYVDVLMSTLQRRDELKNSKFFLCTCQRCRDPTEFGTFCNALRCPKCLYSSILSMDPANQKASWRCTNCDHTFDADMVASILILLTEELEDSVDYDKLAPEKFINRYSTVLGENHYLILTAKYFICQVNHEDTLPTDENATENFLRRREKYGKEVLDIIVKLMPGQSRLKGILMFELYVTILALSGIRLQRKEITKKQFRKEMKDMVIFLQDCEEILKWEPEGSVGRKMADQAKRMLIQLGYD